ncbi:Superoxide dismutase [Halotydeus destructor]|nr:Superoxide dismutase [Halotydeus destructor]
MGLFYPFYLLGSYLLVNSPVPKVEKAIAVIQGNGGSGPTIGSIEFTQIGDHVQIRGLVHGLKPSPSGLHGFHIHEHGDHSRGCTSGGEHFNPLGLDHGDMRDTVRHVGDLGNVRVDRDGKAQFLLNDNVISLNGPFSVIGRSIVIHEKEDDLGRGLDAESRKSGNSGGRIACGIIGIAKLASE